MSTESDIRNAILNWLTLRDHTEAELFRKCRARKFPEEPSKRIICEFTQRGLINQNRFVENYINARQNRGVGPLRIKAELTERGITEEFIEDQLNIADNAWFIKVREVWKKRFKTLPRDYKTRAQQMRFLQYRGFTLEQITSILQNDE